MVQHFSSQPAVRVQNLGMRFALPDGSTRPVLDGISFDVFPGQFVAIIGHSGCGKTTLLRLLMGLLQPTAGAIEIFGQNPTTGARRCAMVFQHAELLPWRTAEANVAFGLELAGAPTTERKRLAAQVLVQVGLADAGRLRPHQLSGGMRQRVGLARALAIDPDILLMDEPFGSLDAFTRAGLQTDLNRLHEQTGKTVIFVTHDVDEAAVMADRIIFLTRSGTIGSDIATGLPRPRGELEQARTSPSFAELRYQATRLLHRPATSDAGRR